MLKPANLFRVIIIAGLLVFLIKPRLFAPCLDIFINKGQPAIYTQASLLSLTLSHLAIVAVASGAAAFVAIGLAILVTRPVGAEFLSLSHAIADIGQAFPPVAVLALAVPAIGFGVLPTVIALFLYGILPIFENTVSGLTNLPESVIESANGMGMTALQKLVNVEIPLALPMILTGVRLSVVIGIATATLGSTVAAPTLGEVIIAGLLSNNLAFVVQGGVLVSLLSVLSFDFLLILEKKTQHGISSG